MKYVVLSSLRGLYLLLLAEAWCIMYDITVLIYKEQPESFAFGCAQRWKRCTHPWVNLLMPLCETLLRVREHVSIVGSVFSAYLKGRPTCLPCGDSVCVSVLLWIMCLLLLLLYCCSSVLGGAHLNFMSHVWWLYPQQWIMLCRLFSNL